MSVRGKVLAALAVPVLVLFLAAAVISGQAITAARAASQTSALTAALAVQDVAGTAIAEERALSILEAKGVEGAREQMLAQRDVTDDELDKRDARFKRLDLSGLDPRVQTAVDETIADRAELDAVRTAIDGSGGIGELPRTDFYTNLIDGALDVPRTLADTTEDRDLAQYLDTYVVVDELLAQQALELPVAAGVIQAAQVGPVNISESQTAASLLASGDALADEARTAVRGLPGDMLLAPPGPGYQQLRRNVTSARPESIPAAAAAQWEQLAAADRQNVLPVRDDVRAQTDDKAQDFSTAATTQAIVTIAATLAAVVLSILIAGLVARTIVNPLRRLTTAAEDVRDRLPMLVEQVAVPGQGPGIDITPISVESTDEVGQLATAFNDVNSTTITVAREQAALRGSIAEMFVNVARRDQVLLNRQLAFLDDLERSEEDPGTLSNLFRLDHLATRMRRNAESLLVLAGIDSGRRVRQPMPASDVIRTASSEIELYDRVRLNLVVDPLMLGHNALNAAHLLAELLENATMFSEPHTPVEVTTGRDERFVYVTVRDHGLGMTEAEIADANRRVATNAATDVVGAQRLGLFVVGRLADRLGTKVRFSAVGEGAGTEVVVSFPAALFVPDSNVPLQAPTDPLEVARQGTQQIGAGTGQTPVFAPSTAGASAELPAVSAQNPTVEQLAPVASTTQSTPVVAEPPLAVPVDIEALTDGTTGTGMPRRRPRTADAAASAPSASLASGPETGAIVLPPLATPALPDDLPQAEESWRPPAGIAAQGATLPSRSKPAPVVEDTSSTESPVLDVSTRSALFSSFRPMGANPSEGHTVELAAAPDVTATDLPVVDDARADYEPVSSADLWAPEPAAAEQWAPAPPAAEQWVPEQHRYEELDDATRIVPPVAPAPADETHPDESYAARAHHTDVPVMEPGPASEASPEPVDEERGEVPPELTFEALPRFDELMADLPTRRSLRESQARKRGLFGRRPRPDSGPDATPAVGSVPARGAAPSTASAAAVPHESPHGTQPRPAESAPAVPARTSAFGQRPAALPAVARAEESPEATRPAVAPAGSGRADAEMSAFAPPTVAGPWNPDAAAAPDAATSSAHPPVGATGAPGSAVPAGRAPLARRNPEPLEPLDPEYIADSVEARSDWMASAVLYEEMSTLLQGSNNFQEGTLADPDDGTYQPARVDSTTTSGLARRSRGSDRDGYVDRFTARIDRDPEQLRARLSAFQSATARGRVEVQDETSSTWTPQSMDYVPDSAPQAR
ncbi:nitrate- and nitrite sensing domain-containing protein [Cellulosimicrobium arenosum]|uniref:histidine kinase n=1 Tax=Cellulosimicrobium arenosum TaxID=2708133 RepID=A0A927G849_9MICO|nr:ATP-binding protein [Cellulosimicrobium arenosum]MBD8078671.1 nitrate- and nitrite sensing domain-containing protein [Cellulosimicrobium arenosum]